jgi:hypothetical protein
LNLTSLQGSFSICQLDPKSEIPAWASKGVFFSITHTSYELSIICEQKFIPENTKCEPNWHVLMIEGPFNFGEIGILDSITKHLAQASISLLAVSTFDTDFVLIKSSQFNEAIKILRSAGHRINNL